MTKPGRRKRRLVAAKRRHMHEHPRFPCATAAATRLNVRIVFKDCQIVHQAFGVGACVYGGVKPVDRRLGNAQITPTSHIEDHGRDAVGNGKELLVECGLTTISTYT